MDTQIFFDDKLLHPETNSGVVLHNNSNLNSFLNGLVSTDNMPNFMQQFLMSSGYVSANQALHTTPVTYFDHAFNSWTFSGTLPLSNSICSFDGASNFKLTTPGWTIGGSDGDFTVSLRVNPDNLSSNNPIFSAFNTSGSTPFLQFQHNADMLFQVRYGAGGGSTVGLESTYRPPNYFYHFENSWDSSAQTWRLFIDGQLVDSQSRPLPVFKSFRLGCNYGGSGYFTGQIDYLHISDCVRHSSNFTPTTPEFDDHTLSLLLFD